MSNVAEMNSKKLSNLYPQFPTSIPPKKSNSFCDIKMKTEAFKNDIKLPLDGASVYISSIKGQDVARGYERVIADAEGLWFELTEDQIYWAKFKRRQRTETRQYWTLPGVTLHQQLVKELNPFPRRHKLAVRLKRQYPSSKHKKGRFYIHVYQVKVNNPNIGTRWLGTGRLTKQLKSAFGSQYHPKQRLRKPIVPYTQSNAIW